MRSTVSIWLNIEKPKQIHCIKLQKNYNVYSLRILVVL